MNEMNNSTMHFKTNVLLKNIIGKDLINNDNIAVLELIKNSFDARASEVLVRFSNLLINDDQNANGKSLLPSTIIIKDNGKGMNLTDISDKWLNIAYSEKKLLKDRRIENFAGAKGVGRFSCDRLGSFLDLYTKKDGGEIIHLHINWTDFEKEDRINLTIQDIDVDCEVISDSDFFKIFHFSIEHGTILKITKLRTQWLNRNTKKSTLEVEKLLSLRRYLEKLVSPNKIFHKNDVSIVLDVPEAREYDKSALPDQRLSGVIENKIFEQLDFATTSIEAEISADGGSIVTVLKDKGETIFNIAEKNTEYKHIKNIKIIIYFLNTYAKAFFTRKSGIRPVDFGSIFLFIDGFRVNPLGDFGNDWLRLDQRKAQGYARYLGTREVIGRIEVNDPEHSIKIVSSREGIVADETTADIVSLQAGHYDGFFYKTLRRLERFVVDGLDWDKVKDSQKAEREVLTKGNQANTNEFILSSKEKNINIINVATSIICQDTIPENIISLFINDRLLDELTEEKARVGKDKLKELINDYKIDVVDSDEYRQVLDKLDKKEKEVRELEQKIKLEEQKNQYLIASKSGIPQHVRDLIHHIKIMTNEINGYVSTMISALEQNSLKKADALQKLNKIKHQVDKTYKVSQLMTFAGFKLQSAKQRFDVSRFSQEYLTSPDALISSSKDLNINVENDNNAFWVYSSIFDISLVFDNLLSNSIKAEAHNIHVKIYSPSTGQCIIDFSDDGNGVDDAFLNCSEELFSLGVTTTNGSGIGLYSVREMLKKVKTANATITFIGNGIILKGACFRIKFENVEDE